MWSLSKKATGILIGFLPVGFSVAAEDLPVTADCAFLKGKVIDEFVVNNREPSDYGVPAAPYLLDAPYSIRIRYPKEYKATSYFNLPVFQGNSVQFGFRLPNGEPWPHLQNAGEPSALNAPRLQIVLSDNYPLRAIIALRSKISPKGPPGFAPISILAKRSEFDGLEEVEPNQWEGTKNRKFISRDPEKFIDFIECSAPRKDRVQKCTHYFEFGHLDVMMEYRFEDLKDWKSVKQLATNFVSCVRAEEIEVRSAGENE